MFIAGDGGLIFCSDVGLWIKKSGAKSFGGPVLASLIDKLNSMQVTWYRAHDKQLNGSLSLSLRGVIHGSLP